MFSKTADPATAPAASATTTAAPASRAATNSKSVLAQDLKITGEISSSGSIEILGEVDGNVAARGVIVGAEGRLVGSVQADTVEVKGKLDGKVAADIFTLRAAAEVTADVTYASLVIESGARIEGKFALKKA